MIKISVHVSAAFLTDIDMIVSITNTLGSLRLFTFDSSYIFEFVDGVVP